MPLASSAESTLGKWAELAAERVISRGWEATVADLRGASNLTETVGRIPHKAARLLDLPRKRGAAVPMSTPLDTSADRCRGTAWRAQISIRVYRVRLRGIARLLQARVLDGASPITRSHLAWLAAIEGLASLLTTPFRG